MEYLLEAGLKVQSSRLPYGGSERRSAERLQVHWPVSLGRSDDEAWIDTTTEDLSSRGFYCISPERYLPGEEIDCRISIPDPVARQTGKWIRLLCRARVVRVETRGGKYGVGCAIENYMTVGGPESAGNTADGAPGFQN